MHGQSDAQQAPDKTSTLMKFAQRLIIPVLLALMNAYSVPQARTAPMPRVIVTAQPPSWSAALQRAPIAVTPLPASFWSDSEAQADLAYLAVFGADPQESRQVLH